MKTIIGLDNGATGSIGVINTDDDYNIISYDFEPTPNKNAVNYQKPTLKRGKKHYTHCKRIDFDGLYAFLFENIQKENCEEITVTIERPLNNPNMYTSTLSAMRALEATVICLEQIGVDYEFIDSKTWQKAILGHDVEGRENLKKKSMKTASALFPVFKNRFSKQKDGDGILIAEYVRRKKSGKC